MELDAVDEPKVEILPIVRVIELYLDATEIVVHEGLNTQTGNNETHINYLSKVPKIKENCVHVQVGDWDLVGIEGHRVTLSKRVITPKIEE